MNLYHSLCADVHLRHRIQVAMWSAVLVLLVAPAVRTVRGADKPAPIAPVEPITAVADTPFHQEYREPFVAWPEASGESRVSLVLDANGTLWAAGPWGVRQRRDGEWQTPEGDGLDGPSFSLALEGKDLWLAAWNGLYRIRNRKLERVALADQPVAVVRWTGGRLLAGGPSGLWERTAQGWQLVPGEYARSITDVVVDGERLWIATQRGLFELRDGKTRRIFAPNDIASGAVTSLDLFNGRVFIGTSGGIDIYQEGRRVEQLSSKDGMPCSEVWRLKVQRRSGRDTLWFATTQGLGRVEEDRWIWRHSMRWLPNSHVHDFVVSADGTVYIATSGGLAIHKVKAMTLAEKAEHYGQLVRERHVREPGLVEYCRLKTPGDLSTHAPTDTDNDGLFTGLYVGAESFRYAVTGDKQAAKNAREGYRAMAFLQTVTGSPGFVARTVIPSDWREMADRNRTFTPQQVATERISNPRFKPVENRWRISADGKWQWKGDTSSDEMTGHYFAYGVYFDLAADEAERRHVADLVRRITDYIIEGGYTLRDIDGCPTTWGVWSPERLWRDPDWQPERGCNAVEILSYLAVAHHLTGDAKYQRELARLFQDERYGEAILEAKLSAPSEFTYIDDQLLALSYRGLLAYDQDPERRKVYLESLRRWFNVVRNDNGSLYAFVAGGVLGGDVGASGCVQQLRAMPLDMIEWTVDNRNREDLRLVRRPVIEHLQVDRLLPPDERALSKWDKNPYQAVGGTGGATESSSVHWLLPYWMGRYYGIVKGR